MRTLTISKNSLYLRFFLWLWEANPEKLDICKLFWGTLFFPIALIQFKKVYRFIPRVTFFYMIGTVLFVALASWTVAIMWFVFAIGCAIYGYITMWRKQRLIVFRPCMVERRKEKEHVLSRVTRRGSVVMDWILEYTIGLAIDLAYDVVDSRAGQCIDGFFGVIAEYIRAAKKRSCIYVRVV